MKNKPGRFPAWYNITLIAVYLLPFAALLIYTAVVLSHLGILSAIAAFPGGIIAGALLFGPFACMYYAVILFAHVLVNELFFRAKRGKLNIANILISFACSASVLCNSVLTVRMLEHEYGWIPFIFMLVGICLYCIFLIARFLPRFPPLIAKNEYDVSSYMTHDEIVSWLYENQLNSSDTEADEVLYSRDKTRKFVISKNDKGYYTIKYEVVHFRDEEENGAYMEIPGWWEGEPCVIDHSFFGTLDEALAEIKLTPEYYMYFII